MADSKKSKPAPKPQVKVLSKKESKKVIGGLASSVGPGAAGPEEFHFR